MNWLKEGGPIDLSPISVVVQAARLATFVNWPISDILTAEQVNTSFSITLSKKVSSAGFVFRAEKDSEDRAECILCGCGLDGWEVSDDPLHEHRRRNPECTFFHPDQWIKKEKKKTKAVKVKKQVEAIKDTTKEESFAVMEDTVVGIARVLLTIDDRRRAHISKHNKYIINHFFNISGQCFCHIFTLP
jgi:Inhibitor of Apoptosis domain